MKYSDVFAQTLVDHGLDVMFGVLGDANMYLGDRYAQQPGARFVATANEAGAVLMAAGYAGVSQRIGAATVTHGAITNCVGALFEASRGHYPLVLLAGDTARGDRFNLQGLPQREIVRPTGAAFIEAGSPDSAARDVAAAVRRAAEDQGPVVLSIPSDFQRADSDAAVLGPMNKHTDSVTVPSAAAVEDAAGLLLSSHRPIILAGRGAARAGAESAITHLAERIGAPVATTLRGQGLFAEDPFNIGVWGTLSSPAGLDAIVKSDCIVVFGASLSPLTTMKGEMIAGKRIIQIDAVPEALGRDFPVTVGIVGDLVATAVALTELVDEAEGVRSSFRGPRLAQELADWRAEDREVRQPTGSLDIRDALHRINALVPRERTLAIDAGRFAHETLRIMDVADPLAYLHALNIAQIGMSLSYGIGGSLGAPDRPSVVMIGDGGFMLGGLTEFNTAVRAGANIVVFVMNDGAYGAEYWRFAAEGLDTKLLTFDWPDFAGVANALGGLGVTVRELADFDAVEKMLSGQTGPILVDVILDRDAVPDPGDH